MIEIFDFVENLDDYSDGDLHILLSKVKTELTTREENRKKYLINNFKRAFNDILSVGTVGLVNCDGEVFEINDFQEFAFNFKEV